MCVQYSEKLPPEIWFQIFDCATTPQDLSYKNATSYIPFQCINPEEDDCLKARRSLLLVSRTWNCWATEFLYTDIRVRCGSALALKCAFQRPGYSGEYGKRVRRVVLPYRSTVTGPKDPLASAEILNYCTQLETLVRPWGNPHERLFFDYEADSVSLPNLKRLEWWHHQAAERTGGINSLQPVLRSAPNLEYLFIGGVMGLRSCVGADAGNIVLAELRILRLQLINCLLLRQIVHRWSLPSLSHVIMDVPLPEQAIDSIWEGFGPQIQTVEFGKHLRFLQNDNITPCLQGCHNLSIINYHIFFTALPDVTEPHLSLTTVGLNASPTMIFNDTEMWTHLERHVDFLTGDALPSLREVVLYGDWAGLLSSDRFVPLHRRFADRGLVICT